MTDTATALARLRDGNRRFVSGRPHHETRSMPTRLAGQVSGQEPFAIVLGCSDSRVPAELVFDQGLGDLFVIRVAGNIVAPSLVGSVEFAASRFRTRLVVALGPSRCGAIPATLEELRRPAAHQSPNLRSIVERVRPSVEGLEALIRQDGLVIVAAEYSLEAGVVEFFDDLGSVPGGGDPGP